MKPRTAKVSRNRKNKKPVSLTIPVPEDTVEALRRATPEQIERLRRLIMTDTHEVDAWRECPDCKKDFVH